MFILMLDPQRHQPMSDSDKLLYLLPDVRDGINRKERLVLYCLMQTQNEFKDRNVPTITLYGRVLEHIDMSQAEFQQILSKMVGLTRNSDDPTRLGQ